MGRPAGSKNKKPNQSVEVAMPRVVVPGEKKRGRPSKIEMAERAKVTRDAENRLKDQINAASEARMKSIEKGMADPKESFMINESSVLEPGTSIPESPTGFFFKNGQLIKMRTPSGEWQNGTVIKHPLDMPDLVRILWDNGAQDWRAAKNLHFLR